MRHKTQVFFLPNNDHICTRLEHSIHVASASRSVARELGLNEDLAEAIGLAHDLGHAPFGHHGEEVLNKLASEHQVPIIFEHEIYGLRVVDRLAELDRSSKSGLNLTYEVRNGIICHCGEDLDSYEIKPEVSQQSLSSILSKKEAPKPCTLEGCIVRMVDKIVYAGRDIEDALVANLIKETDIPDDITSILGKHNGEIIGKLLQDLIKYCDTHHGKVGLSHDKGSALKKLIDFNYKKIYQHEKVEKFKEQATNALEELFSRLVKDLKKTERFKNDKEKLPDSSDTNAYDLLKNFIENVGYSDNNSNELIVLDFIAGMTDNYVIRCLEEIFLPKAII